MDDVFEHVGLHSSPVEDTEPKNRRDYSPMSVETENRLRRFYEPYDEALRLLLRRETLPWPSGPA